MKLFFLSCFCFSFFISSAQDKNQFYALDANMNQTVLDSSTYILWIHEKEDSNWQWDYYRTWGSMVQSQSFADHDGKILNGKSYLYNTLGNLDSVSEFDHGKKNGTFFKYRTFSEDSIHLLMKYVYAQDSLISKKDMLTYKDSVKSDTAGGVESEYPGGMQAWYEYLSDNLKYPIRASNKGIKGTVKAGFTISADGDVYDIYIVRSIEYSLDQETIKIIKDSGKWQPTTQNGIRKKSYKMQPVNFKF